MTRAVFGDAPSRRCSGMRDPPGRPRSARPAPSEVMSRRNPPSLPRRALPGTTRRARALADSAMRFLAVTGSAAVLTAALAAAAYAARPGRASWPPPRCDQVHPNVQAWLTGILAAVATLFLVRRRRPLPAWPAVTPARSGRAKQWLESAAIGYGLAMLAPVLVQLVGQWVVRDQRGRTARQRSRRLPGARTAVVTLAIVLAAAVAAVAAAQVAGRHGGALARQLPGSRPARPGRQRSWQRWPRRPCRRPGPVSDADTRDHPAQRSRARPGAHAQPVSVHSGNRRQSRRPGHLRRPRADPAGDRRLRSPAWSEAAAINPVLALLGRTVLATPDVTGQARMTSCGPRWPSSPTLVLIVHPRQRGAGHRPRDAPGPAGSVKEGRPG